ncbi:MAG: VCBS repeat-containing protein [Lewinellaceae bacterium]|nr:VCBS repeat-containing protein [Lewinellaceae bacterium]
MGVDVSDFNNDGWMDIYIANLYANILLLNKGDGTFADISAAAGIDDPGMGWGVSLLDFDNDGWLDIYVANDYSFSPHPNVLYRNLGNLTFTPVEVNDPVANRQGSYGTASWDFNLDGNLDLGVTNRWDNNNFQLFQNADRLVNGLHSNWWVVPVTGKR